MKYFDLWNLSTRNLVADSESEADLLALVREMAEAHGPEAVADWGLGWADDEDDEAGEMIARGQDLIERALREAAA